MITPTMIVYYTITKSLNNRVRERCVFLFYGTLEELPEEITDRGLACRRVVGPVTVHYRTEPWEDYKHLALQLKTDKNLKHNGREIKIP